MIHDDVLHLIPEKDLVDHVPSEECVCGPHWELTESDDGIIFQMVTHHSLDGREKHE
jgi:hypothetical protein